MYKVLHKSMVDGKFEGKMISRRWTTHNLRLTTHSININASRGVVICV
jgi:hypothetical protein